MYYAFLTFVVCGSVAGLYQHCDQCCGGGCHHYHHHPSSVGIPRSL